MKIYIASDLHGSSTSAKKLVEKANGSYLIILGDIYNHGPRNPLPDGYAPMMVAGILNTYEGKLTVIKGNCDSEVDQMISKFTFQDYHEIVTSRSFFFTHGHKFNIDTPPGNLKKGDVCFYGHIHKPFIKESNGVYFINPGSCALPINDAPLSYAVLDTTSDAVKIYDFDDNVVDEINFNKADKK